MTTARKTARRRPASARGIGAAAIAIAGAVLCGCSAPTNPTTGPGTTAPTAQACLGDTDRPTDQPLPSATTDAKTATLSSTPVTGAGYSWSGGDTVYSLQSITDFPVPAGVVAATDDVVLASYTVTTTYPGGWNQSQSLQATAFSKGNGVQLLTRSCPSRSDPILQAMRAAGHVPLPDHIPAGQTVTGWAAFVIPRTVTDLTMRVQHVSPEGGGAISYPLLHIPHP